MNLRKVLAITLLITASAFGLTGCGGGAASYVVVEPPDVNLAGTNGDMSKYLGTWVSACGNQFKINSGAAGTSTINGVINTFTLTTISGNAVQGTLVSEIYETLQCGGLNSKNTYAVSLQYAGNRVAVGQSGSTPSFSGTADNVTLSEIGASVSSPYGLAFRENFSKFQLTSLAYFGPNDLVYTKK